MPEPLPPTALREFRPGLWLGESWLRVAGLVLQTRMFVLRLRDGLLIDSPSPADPDEQLRDQILALGTPRWMVAPNEIHNVGLRSFQAWRPDVHTTGCVGHPGRVPGVRFDAILDPSSPQDTVPWTASGEVRFHVIGGNAFLHEIALMHVPSRTLVLADAVENLDQRHFGRRVSRPMWAMLRWGGLRRGEPCTSPEHHLYAVDPDALRASLEVLEGWEPEAIVLCHGDPLEGPQAREGLRRAFERTITAVRDRSRLTRALWSTMARFG